MPLHELLFAYRLGMVAAVFGLERRANRSTKRAKPPCSCSSPLAISAYYSLPTTRSRPCSNVCSMSTGIDISGHQLIMGRPLAHCSPYTANQDAVSPGLFGIPHSLLRQILIYLVIRGRAGAKIVVKLRAENQKVNTLQISRTEHFLDSKFPIFSR